MKKKSVFSCLFLLLFSFSVAISGCAHLLPGPENKPDLLEKEKLQAILDGVDYRGWKYELGVFDCSNMTAYLYDYLTARGYDCEIMTGAVSLKDLFTGWGHAWLIARKNGQEFWIESIRRKVVDPSNYDAHVYRWRFSSLKEVKFLFSLIGLSQEWDY